MGARAIDQLGYELVQSGRAGQTAAADRVEATDTGSARATSGAQGAVSVDVIPSSPPDEVLDGIEAASAAFDRIAAGGPHVDFALDRPTGRVQIELQDASGQPISGLSPSDALRLAEGDSLD
jgi:hypothetical protein